MDIHRFKSYACKSKYYYDKKLYNVRRKVYTRDCLQ